MADDELRESERAWRATPDDQAALARHIAALRRAGRVVPEALLDARVQPARTFRSRVPARVLVPREGGRQLSAGSTGATGVVEVPVHPWFKVAAIGELGTDELHTLAQDCAEQAIERVEVRLRAGVQPVGLDWTARTHVALDSAVAVDSEVLSGLGGQALVGLTLSGAQTPGRLAPLVDAAPALERLDLGLVFGMGDQDMVPLGALPRLRALSLRAEGPQVRDALRGRFLREEFSALRELELRDLAMGGEELRLLAARPLRALALELAPSVGEGDVRQALASRSLEELTLRARRTSPAALGILSDLPLTSLSLSTGESLAASFLRTLPASLKQLSVCTGGPLTWVDRFPALTSLSLDAAHEDGLDLRGLGAATDLRTLSLTGGPLFDVVPGTAALGELRGLSELSLSRLWVSPGPLRRLERLARVTLSGPSWTDDDVEQLAACPALEEVTLLACEGLGPRALDPLSGVSSLRALRVSLCGRLPHEELLRFRSTRSDVDMDQGSEGP